jgi:phosphatidylinositol alpha-1,6-mannosyltransferase
MRVLVLAPKYFGVGGAEAYTRMLARAIAEEGARVEMLSLLAGEAVDGACPGRYLGDQGSGSTAWARLRFLSEAVRYGRGHDLVMCGHVSVAPLGLMLSRFFGVPYVVVGYGIDVWGTLAPGRRAALRRAARVVTVSHFTAGMVASVHGVPTERISVIHPAVDPGLLEQAAAKEDRLPPGRSGPLVLLTVARLSARERYKGCDTVISALPMVAAEAGPVRYVVVGDGDDRPRLTALAHEQGVASMVTFAGSVARADLAARYGGCDIFVMPSVAERRPDGWVGEGFGIVYIEASAFGRPVIAGRGGGAPEAVKDGITGLLVDGSDVDAVAGALIRLAQDADLRTRMGEAGRRWVHEYFAFSRFRRDVGQVVTGLQGVATRQ